MSETAVAFVPCAPLLVPAIAGGSADLDAALRAHVTASARRLIEAAPAEILIVAPTSTACILPPTATWDFSGFGVPRRDRGDRAALPWSLGIGAWLLDECGWDGGRRYLGVGAGQAEITTEIPTTTAILALGDGSARRTEKAPGHLDPRAEAFDASIADALRTGDSDALGGLDPALARELMCAGYPVWRWLVDHLGERQVSKATLDAAEAPYGVGYFVASWTVS